MSEFEEHSENNEISNSPESEKTVLSKLKKLKKIKKRKTKEEKLKKKAEQKKKKGIHIGIGMTMLVLFCSFLLVVATFLQLNITHFIIPPKLFLLDTCTIDDYLFSIKYIPQIPIAMFIVGLLGRKFGFISILTYIIAGLFFMPVFALGGGWRYVGEYSFGYILAFLPAAIILGSVIKKDYSYKNVAKAVLLSVLTIHLIGIIYMTGLAYFRHAGLEFVTGWIAAQSGLKIIYDLIFSYLLVLLSKYARIILWFYM